MSARPSLGKHVTRASDWDCAEEVEGDLNSVWETLTKLDRWA